MLKNKKNNKRNWNKNKNYYNHNLIKKKENYSKKNECIMKIIKSTILIFFTLNCVK